MEPYPVTEAFDGGMLDVGDGHAIHWEVAGNPTASRPSSCTAARARRCRRGPAACSIRERYRIVQFDQRQCGRSTPHAAEPVVDLSTNTTAHLLGDMELLREHLGIDRWVLWGGSWGTLLGADVRRRPPDPGSGRWCS